MVDITVAIPTYNGADRLPIVLEALRSQVNTKGISWEVLVVDNNSTDNTAKVVAQFQTDWPTSSPLRYCVETRQGAAYARQRAMHSSQSIWVGLLDDDNIPAADWVAQACQFGKAHPQVGAFGGQIHGQFESPPSPDFRRIQSFFAIRERGDQPHRYDPDTLSLPPTAAVVVCRNAWLESVPQTQLLVGRVGDSMIGGEDFEVMLHMHHHGWEIWYTPTMHAYHQIPSWRLERDYMQSLIKAASLCICPLRLINVAPQRQPIIAAKVFLGALRRVILHWLKYRGTLATDDVAACEMTFFVWTMLSPLYMVKQRWL
ncbi:hormogonium polysaccharide biosynthesis glycosyltransferase HpsE [Leptothoe spongobia]|uniref:Glycosyltransferase family 2 protein n=1 Tax=Leptothoe spongobia TAU-MAC 1115 TaxID=1967444 RepID=A0A947GKK7_9CYAN|nr:hormogonium polysaccharide biosynthesis glycosyltransferase HpsE [Leptothoe spongobia]MBT9317529.1 glycosyltransferase family 2 protein [Leptothoe spongobia TAU-MAC 1115]